MPAPSEQISDLPARTEIRPCHSRDMDQVLGLWERCDLPPVQDCPESGTICLLLQQILDCPDSRCYGLFVDTVLKACLVASWNGVRAAMLYPAIDPTGCDGSMFLRLTDHAESWLRSRGAGQASLSLAGCQPEAKGWFLSAGYREAESPVLFRRLDSALLPTPEPVGQTRIDVTITFLHMRRRPARAPCSLPPGLPQPRLEHMQGLDIPFYRYLYDRVGRPWGWWERKRMSDPALTLLLQDEAIEIHVLFLPGSPVGFFELDRRIPGEVNLAWFGLVPELTGRKLGGWFLDQAIFQAWDGSPGGEGAPELLKVNTCTLDHPAALKMYQRHGFRAIQQDRLMIDNPFL